MGVTIRIAAPGFFDDPVIRAAWLRSDWTGPVRISLDPLKDAKADEADRNNGFKTSQQIIDERTGGEYDVKTNQLKRENAALKDAGQGGSSVATAPPPEPDPADLKEDIADA